MNIRLLMLATLLFTSFSSYALEVREDFPLAEVQKGSVLVERPITTRVFPLLQAPSSWQAAILASKDACASFSYEFEDSVKTEIAESSKSLALSGGEADPYPYSMHPFELSMDSTLAQLYENQPFEEYKSLIKQNQWCQTVASYEYKKSFGAEIAVSNDAQISNLRTPEQLDDIFLHQSYWADEAIIEKMYTVFNPALMGLGVNSPDDADTLADINNMLNSFQNTFTGVREATCKVFKDPALTEVDFLGFTDSIQPYTASSIFNNTNLHVFTDGSFYSSFRLGFLDNPGEWKSYCTVVPSPTPIPAPEGKEASSLLTLNSLGYNQVPQTRASGRHSNADFSNSPYSIGVININGENEVGQHNKSQFGILSESLEPYMSTGIQNAPVEDEGNPHKFYYERHPDDFESMIGNKAIGVIQGGAGPNSALMKLMGNLSSDPLATGYAIKPNIGADATLFPTSIEGLNRMLSKTSFLMSTTDNSLSSGSWGSNPFNTKFLDSSAQPYKPKIIDLYNKGFNWDDKKCTKSGDKDCVFAMSVVLSGAGCGGMYFSNSQFGEDRRINDLTSEYRNNGSGWFSTSYLSTKSNRRCDLKNNQQIKGDYFYNLSYDEMNTPVSFGLDDLGVLLRPGYFFTKKPATIADFSLSQMKMARYEGADNNGLDINTVNGVADIVTTKKYQTTPEYCEGRGMSSVVRDGKTYCEAEPCEAGLDFDTDTGICVNKDANPCPAPTFTDPSLTIKPGSLSTVIQNGRCLSTYNVHPTQHSNYFDSDGNEIPFDPSGNSYSQGTIPTETFQTASINEGLYDSSPELWRQGGIKESGIWKAYPSKIVQMENGEPTYYLKNKLFGYGTFEGDFKVTNEKDDDDFVGIVFGYKSIDEIFPGNSFESIPANAYLDRSATYYVIDWKQAVQSGKSSKRGFSIKRILNQEDGGDMWVNDTSTSPNILHIDYSDVFGGWKDNVKYTMKLDLSYDNIKFYIKEASEDVSKYVKIFDVDATTKLYDEGVAEVHEGDEYYFPSGRFGFYNLSQDYVEYSNFRISDFTEIKCDPSHTSLTDKYGLSTGVCQESKQMSCPGGLSPIGINNNVVCGVPTSKCSLADLSQTIINGSVSYGKCSYLAVDATSVDVLKDVTSRVFYNSYFKNMGDLSLVKPVDIINQEVPSSAVERLRDVSNWQVNDEAEYAELNDILASSKLAVSKDEFDHIVKTYSINEKSKEKLNTLIGMELDKLPKFQVDALGLNVEVKIRELNDMNIGALNRQLSCSQTEREVARFPTGDLYPVSLQCMSLNVRIEGLYKYNWDPRNHRLSVPFSIKIADKKTFIVEGNDTYIDEIPNSYNLSTASESELLENTKSFLKSESLSPDSLIVAAIKCSEYVFDAKVSVLANDSNALITGNISCYDNDVEESKEQKPTFSRFVSSAPTSLDDTLEESPKVVSKLGRLVDNPLNSFCKTDLSQSSTFAEYKVKKITDSLSGQEYEDKTPYARKITLNYPHSKTTPVIKAKWVKNETSRHLNKFLGDVELDANGGVLKVDGFASALRLSYPDSVLHRYLTDSGTTNLADVIVNNVKAGFPYNKDKIAVKVPVSSFKTNAEMAEASYKELGEALHLVSNSIDGDGYDNVAKSSFVSHHNDISGDLKPVSNLKNGADNGLMLPTNILSPEYDVKDLGDYEFVDGKILVNKYPLELPIINNNLVAPSCSYIDPIFESGEVRVPVNQYTINSQDFPSVVRLKDGSFVAAWRSVSQNGGLSSLIYARLLNPDGTSNGDEFLVSADLNSFQVMPKIFPLSNGGFVIAWYTNITEGVFFNARVYDSSANPVGAEIKVTDPASRPGDFDISSVTTASNLSDGFVVSYSEKESDGSHTLYMQLIDGDGQKKGGPKIVSTTNESDQRHPSIAPLNDGFVVAWHSSDTRADSWDIYAQVFDKNGNKIGGEFLVNDTTSAQQAFAQVASTEDGDSFVIAWASYSWLGGASDDEVGFKIYKSNSPVPVSQKNWESSGEFSFVGESRRLETDSISIKDDRIAISFFQYQNDPYTDTEVSVRVGLFDMSGNKIAVVNPAPTGYNRMFGGELASMDDGKFLFLYHNEEGEIDSPTGAFDVHKSVVNQDGQVSIMNAVYKLQVDPDAYQKATASERRVCTEIYGDADLTSSENILTATLHASQGSIRLEKKPLELVLPESNEYLPLLLDGQVARFLGCNQEALVVGDSVLGCDVNNINTYGANKWSVVDSITNKNVVYIEIDDSISTVSLRNLKLNNVKEESVTMHSNKFAVDSSGTVIQNDADIYTSSTFKTTKLLSVFKQLMAFNNTYKVKSYPVNFGNGGKGADYGYLTFTMASGEEGIDNEVAESISEVRNVCMQVSDYDDKIATELSEVAELYNFVRFNMEDDPIVEILMEKDASNVRVKTYDGTDVQKKKFFGGWSGCGIECIHAKLSAKVSAEDALMTYLNNECSDASSVYSQSSLSTGTPVCDKVDEFFGSEYNKSYPDFGVQYKMPRYKDFFTGSNPGSLVGLDGFGSSRMTALASKITDISFNLGIWGKKEWYYQVNTRSSLQAQVLRGLTLHESDFLRQAAGSIDTEFVEECTAQLATTGEVTSSRDRINFTRLLSDKVLFKHLSPTVRNQTPEEYAKYTSKFNNNFSKATASGTISGALGEIEASEVCSSFINKKTMVGHPVFNNIINRAMISDLSLGGDGVVSIVSSRVVPENAFLDKEKSPNWLQGKVCKDSYLSVPYALSRAKIHENPDVCDGSIYSAQCYASPRPSPGLIDAIFRSSRVKRDFQNWASDTIQMTANLCGKGATNKTSLSDLSTPTNRTGKTIVITKPVAGGSNEGYEPANNNLLYAVETGILVNANDVDKAKMGISLIDNPIYNNTLMINYSDIFSGIVNKKTGITREPPNSVIDNQKPPTISVESGDPIERLINKCMTFKSTVAYKKPKSYGGYVHTYKKTLIKTYPNKGLEFVFVDPRNEQQREVKKCSDIFISSNTLYKDTEKMSTADRKSLYLKEFLASQGVVESYEEDFDGSKDVIERHRADLTYYNSDDGYTIEEQKGGSMKMVVKKNKEGGVSKIGNSAMKDISIGVPNTENENQAQKDAITAAKGKGDGADAAIEAGFGAVIDIVDTASFLGIPAISAVADQVKTGLTVTKTVVSVSGAVQKMKDIQNQNTDIKGVVGTENEEISFNESQVGEIVFDDRTALNESPEELVNRVIAFEAKLESAEDEKPEPSQYNQKLEDARSALDDNAEYQSFGNGKDDEQNININNSYTRLKLDIDSYNNFKSNIYGDKASYDDDLSNYINESRGNEREVKFRAISDYNTREESGFDSEFLRDANDMTGDSSSAKGHQNNIENSYKSYEDMDLTISNGPGSLQYKLEQQIKHQQNNFGIFHENNGTR